MNFTWYIAFIVLFPLMCHALACYVCDRVQPKHQGAIEDTVLTLGWLAAIAIVWNY